MTTAFCDDISETDVLCTIDDCGCRFDHCHVLMRCLPNV
jgi:hypothetical protein